MAEIKNDKETQTLKLNRKEVLIVTSKKANSAVVFVVDINKICGISFKYVSTQYVPDVKESYAEQGYEIKEYILAKGEHAFVEIERTSFEDVLCVEEKTIHGVSTICVDPVKQLLKVYEISFEDFVFDKDKEQALKQLSEYYKTLTINKKQSKDDKEIELEI